jgi:SAM-dependent methyltransferase
MQHWWMGLADAPPTEASALHALGLGFMAARTLHVALEFRLFTHLAAGPAALADVASALGLSARAATRLLQACAALGLVQLGDGKYRNVPVVDKYLVEGRPTYIGSYIRMFDALVYHRWGELSTALRTDRPVDALEHPYRYFNQEADAAQTFLAAQHSGSTSLGYALAKRFDFTPFRCVLDLGGGAGTYAIEIVRRYPHLQAIVFDFPQVCPIADAAIRQAGLTHRIRTVAGDYERDPLPTGPDVVLWSGNLHASSPARCADILHKLRELLPAYGAVLIHDYLLDDSGTGPLIPALLALHLTLVSDDGQVYSGKELRALLRQAGFPDVSVQPFLPGHSGLIIGRAGDRNTEA